MRNKKRRIKHQIDKFDNLSITLDIHGYRYKEAQEKILKHIDDLYYSNLHFVRIIHGHGEGTLKTLVRKLFKDSNKIKNYYASEGDAITIGEFIILERD